MNLFDLYKIQNDHQLRLAQDPMELLWLVNMVDRIKPEVVVEIGIESSGGIKYWETVSAPNATIIGIDINFGAVDASWNVNESPKDIQYVRGDSHDVATLDRLLNILDGRKIDFLFIDGDHTYDGVRRDWEMYSPIVRDGGMVAFHDVNDHCGPGKLFAEIRKHNKKHVLVNPIMGTGIVQMIDSSYWETVNYYHKSGYDSFMEKAIPYYSAMNRGELPVSLAEHIRPTRAPAIELLDPANLPMPTNLPKVSFIIASFNAAHALERVLNAINEQKYPKEKIEVIVVDDCSADNYMSYFVMSKCVYVNSEGSMESPWDLVSQTYISPDLLNAPEPYVYELNRLAEVYPELRITYARLANHKTWNRAGSINTGSRMARGDIFVFLRGDTLVIPEKFCEYCAKHHSYHPNLYLHSVTVENRYQVRADQLFNWQVLNLPQDHWPEWPGSSIRAENWRAICGYNEQRVGWGGLENVIGSMADHGMVQAIEPRCVASGFLGMFRFTAPREYYQMMSAVMAQSRDAYEWRIPNDDTWGTIPLSVKREWNNAEGV